MATSETEIVNLALVRLGHKQTITSLDEGTPKADIAKVLYEPTRDTVLEAHPWNFAIRRAELSRSTEEPAFEFQYRFALPSGPNPPYCLRVIRTRWDAGGFASHTPYRIEGRHLLANADECAIEYIARVTDVAQYSSSFVTTLSLKLAAELALPLTDDARVVQSMTQLYEASLRDARTSDAQEGTPREVIDDSGWIMSRI